MDGNEMQTGEDQFYEARREHIKNEIQNFKDLYEILKDSVDEPMSDEGHLSSIKAYATSYPDLALNCQPNKPNRAKDSMDDPEDDNLDWDAIDCEYQVGGNGCAPNHFTLRVRRSKKHKSLKKNTNKTELAPDSSVAAAAAAASKTQAQEKKALKLTKSLNAGP